MRDVKLLKERGRVTGSVSPVKRQPAGQWVAAIGIFGFGFVLGATTSSPSETTPQTMSLEELANQTKALDTIAHAAQLDARVAGLARAPAIAASASLDGEPLEHGVEKPVAEEANPSLVAETSDAVVAAQDATPQNSTLSLGKALRGLQEELTPESGIFTVQVSSFPTTEEASAFARKLERKGFEPYVTAAEIPGRGTWHRVRVGNYRTKDGAEGLRSRLAAVDVAGLVLRARGP